MNDLILLVGSGFGFIYSFDIQLRYVTYKKETADLAYLPPKTVSFHFQHQFHAAKIMI